MKLSINPVFKDLIPPLTPEEFSQLEENCLKNGIMDSIQAWQGVIIDGHNRYEIAKKHNLNFFKKEMQFESEQDAIKHIILNQFGRRNISKYQRSVLALQLEEMYKAKAKENQKLSEGRGKKGCPISDNLIETIDTKKELAKIASVGHDTIAKVKKIQAKAPEELKLRLQNNDVSINEAYKEVRRSEKTEIIKKNDEEKEQITNNEQFDRPEIHCLDYKEYLASIPDNSIDLLITDPPYSTDIENIKEFANDWISLTLPKIKRNGRAFICIGAYPVELHAYLEILLKQQDFILDNPIIWTYRNTLGVTPKMKYNLNYQIILHLYSDKSEPLDNTITNEMFSVQDINAPDGRLGNRYHTWQKPDELARRLIKHTTKENDSILDIFACTGTFALMACKMKRKAFACDISKENLEIAKKRGCLIV